MSPDLSIQQAWAAAAGWGRETRMNEMEALMWRSERHPRLSSTILALMVLDQCPENFLVMNGDILTNIDYADLLQTPYSVDSILVESLFVAGPALILTR